MSDQPQSETYFLTLYKGSLIPLYACRMYLFIMPTEAINRYLVAGLTWFIHDHGK